MTVTGWKLDTEERGRLLERFPPAWPDVIADHITLKSGAAARERLPCETHAEIVGGLDDGEGLQAMVVSIAGTTDRDSEERRVGTECVCTGRSRGAQDHYKK